MNGLLLLILALFLSGCAPLTYQVQVNGYTQPGAAAPLAPAAAIFVIDNHEAKNPLLEKEIAGKIGKLLEKQGYSLAPFEKADYYLLFYYGQGPGRSVSVPMPVYDPLYYPYYGRFWQPYWFVPIPDYYYVPYVQTVYDRWLLINVVEGKRYREKGEFHPLWVGEARSTGTSADLRTTINYLLVAVLGEFGKDTGKARLVEVEQEDLRVKELAR